MQSEWQFLLSQYLRVRAEDETPKSESHQRNQTISAVVVAVARYSASTEERATTIYFLLFQENIESPRKTHNPVGDLQSITSPAQSAL